MKLKITTLIFLFCVSFLLMVPSVQADSFAQGVLKSENVLLGSDVTSIDSVDVTASVLASTSVSISFSQDRVNFYSSAGTEGGWDECQNGETSINLSSLGWNDSVLYYKLKLETEDSTITPSVQEVKLNFTGTVGSFVPQNAHRQGVFESKNAISGASVESINGVNVVASVPGGTSVKIQFSNDTENWYNSTSVELGWDECQDGENYIDLSGLGWTYPSLYYRLKFESVDSAMRSSVSEVSVDFDGSDDGPAPNEDGYWALGSFTSEDVLESGAFVFEQPAYFGYEISYMPSADSVKAQFSYDGENWYNSSGELWGWDTLSEGENLYEDSALSLEALNWEGEQDFYYRLKLKASADGLQSPIISRAGLSLPRKHRVFHDSGDSSGVNGLVGHWTFDGRDMQWDNTSAEVRDSSGQGNHGSLQGGMGTQSASIGQIGQALSFDGVDDYVDIPSDPSHYVQDELTVSAWIKWNGSSKTADYVTKDFQTRVFSLYQVDASTLRFWAMSGGNWIGDSYDIAFTPEVGKWYHIVGVRNGTYQWVYIDTVQQYEVEHGHGDINTGSDIAIGGRGYATIDGQIDDVRIYNRALSESEIEQLYRKGSGRFVIMPEKESFTCGDNLTDDRDSEVYATVEVGDQCWMAEDLRYDDGCTGNIWNDTEPYNACDDAVDGSTDHGNLLYQWDAAMDGSEEEGAQGLCPVGWHIPTDEELKMLEGAVDSTYGYPNAVWDGTGERGDDAGDNLKDPSVSNWLAGTQGWDTGWDGLPGGFRLTDGTLFNVGSNGYWWSSSVDGGNAWRRDLFSFNSGVYRNSSSQAYGFSVRCLRD